MSARRSSQPESRSRPLKCRSRQCLLRSAVSMRVLFAIPFFLILLAGCKPVGPNYTRPTYTAPATYKETGSASVVPPPNPAGGGWQSANPSDGMLRGKWWEIYQDPQLNQLEERIATNNVQLRQAGETYLAAHDQVAAARANYYPTASANVSAAGNQTSEHAPNFNKGSFTSYGTYILSGQATWEPDFLGSAFAALLKQRMPERRPAPQTSRSWT